MTTLDAPLHVPERFWKPGSRRVVAGMKDPNPLVSGGGIRRLRRAGVRVDVGVLEKECRELNAPFCKYITRKRPFVTLKAAASLDGKVATRSGDSRWISSETSRNYVHRLRQAMDAVMVGIGTVLKDDPLLTVRLPGGKKPRQPLRVIVDSRLRIPLHSQLVRTARAIPDPGSHHPGSLFVAEAATGRGKCGSGDYRQRCPGACKPERADERAGPPGGGVASPRGRLNLKRQCPKRRSGGPPALLPGPEDNRRAKSTWSNRGRRSSPNQGRRAGRDPEGQANWGPTS